MKSKRKEIKKYIILSVVFFAMGIFIGGKTVSQETASAIANYKRHEVAEVSPVAIVATVGSFVFGAAILTRTRFRRVVF